MSKGLPHLWPVNSAVKTRQPYVLVILTPPAMLEDAVAVPGIEDERNAAYCRVVILNP